MSGDGRIEAEAVGLVAKAAKSVLRTAVGAAGGAGERAATSAGERAATHAAEQDAGRHVLPLAQDEIDRITALPRGERPDPATYLPQDYIDEHLGQFDDGATRFMTDSNLSKYGIAQRDGTSFVMPKNQVDDLVARTGGDPRAMERELGLPEGFFDSNQVVRVDVPDPGDHGLRMPSGNEAGANDQWLPGGLLPNGISEAVIDGGGIGPGGYVVSNFP